MPLSPGQIINNRYRIVKLLGQGGFGAVYRAWDTNLEATRAIKENLDDSPKAQRQFKREAQILDKLSHPNLPRVIDHFIISGMGQYLVMDFVEGEDLAEILQRAGGPLPEAQVLAWISQVCDALSYLHSQSPPIIHRDIKPANIKIRPDGRAMLVDFGIAKVYDPNRKTTSGAQAVTPGYSPQEQYGQGTTDARTDVYALGATLYHLLTGKRPVESIQRHLDIQFDPPGTLNPLITPQTETAILKAMEMHPNRRFQSVAEFESALIPNPLPPTALITPAVERTQSLPFEQPEGESVAGKLSEIPQTRQSKPFPWKWIGFIAGAAALIFIVASLAIIPGTWRPINQLTTSTAATLALKTTVASVQAPVATDTPQPSPTDTRRPTPSNTSHPMETRQPTASITPPSTNTLTPTDLPTRITDEAGAVMALIPASNWRGALDAFYIDIYEVTNALYAKCVRAGVCDLPNPTEYPPGTAYYGNLDYANYPVIFVVWQQAQTFCEWRGARLPSEIEWERAARGGLEGKLYPWGDEAPTCQAEAVNGAEFSDCIPRRPVQVGRYGPNGYGLFDMAGNVREWVADWFNQSLNSRGQRGGSWSELSVYLRVAIRDGRRSDRRSAAAGFRCARSP